MQPWWSCSIPISAALSLLMILAAVALTAPARAQTSCRAAAAGAPSVPVMIAASVLDDHDPVSILTRYRGEIRGQAGELGTARNQGFSPVSGADEIAAETLQILGQIVVDRSTQAAYRLLQDKILDLLRCPTRSDGSVVERAPPTWFPETCRVVASVRMQDVATSRAAVYSALLGDAITAMLTRASAARGMKLDWEQKGMVELRRIVVDLIVPELVRLQTARGSVVPEDVVFRLLDKVLVGELEGPVAEGKKVPYCENDATSSMFLAGAVVAKCRLLSSPPDRIALTSCPVPELSLQMGKELQKRCGMALPSTEGIASARGVAASIIKALSAARDGVSDVQLRTRHAIDASFDAGCMFIEPDKIADHRCPAKLEPNASPTEEITKPEQVASLARALLVAGIEGDTNTVVAGAFRAVEHVVVLHYIAERRRVSDEEKKKLDEAERVTRRDMQRALRLLGGILQHAETYTKSAPKDDKATQAQHEQRTKILESLTRDMTNRRDRGGDAIFSLGGSLRAAGGARVSPTGADSAKFYGPVSLPIGFGLQAAKHVHVELSLVDLGQYLSYQEGGKVRKPEPLDALAPSVTLGAYWGTEFPFMIGATVGYSPQYGFDSAGKKDKGSINVGLAAGVYVPFLDLN
ncbi:Hypothetical protein A7982_04460 [Minicystis rosea]|nr:Hypothetical protein A7982_04460 [Minicystis rosea]